MTLKPIAKPSTRRFPRMLAYPILLSIPIAGIYGGIRLGSIDSISNVALASQNGTPVENWTLFFLSLGIVSFMYLTHSYAHGTWRVRPASLITALVSLAALLLFGAWGLYGLTAISLMSFAFYWRKRRSQTQTQAVRDNAR